MGTASRIICWLAVMATAPDVAIARSKGASAAAAARSPAKTAAGLGGLGPPGGLIKKVDPKTLAFEKQVLAAINTLRKGASKEPLRGDIRLQGFCRREAETAARGDPSARHFEDRLRQQALAPFGHFMQFAYGATQKEVLSRLRADARSDSEIQGEYSRAGIGAFWVPDTPPYFQVAVLLVRAPDPRAGKPGLSRAQTDPVVSGASERFRGCYDRALKTDPNLGGEVVMRLTIGAQGKVDAAKIVHRFGPEMLEGCLLAIARDLQFPRPYKGKPVTLTHPLRFTPPNGGRRMGVLSTTQIRGTFDLAREDIKRCYDARVAADPELEGSLTLSITVDATGGIKSLRVSHDNLGDQKLTQCVVRRAQRLRFPRPKHGGEVDIKYPLRFAPSEFRK